MLFQIWAILRDCGCFGMYASSSVVCKVTRLRLQVFCVFYCLDKCFCSTEVPIKGPFRWSLFENSQCQIKTNNCVYHQRPQANRGSCYCSNKTCSAVGIGLSTVVRKKGAELSKHKGFVSHWQTGFVSIFHFCLVYQRSTLLLFSCLSHFSLKKYK